jgi:hypothetical protein
MNYEQLEQARMYDTYLPWKEHLSIRRAEREKKHERIKRFLESHNPDCECSNEIGSFIKNNHAYAKTCCFGVRESCVFKAECQEALNYYNSLKNPDNLTYGDALKCLNVGKCNCLPMDYNEKHITIGVDRRVDVCDWGEYETCKITLKFGDNNEYDKWKDEETHIPNVAFRLLCGIHPTETTRGMTQRITEESKNYYHYIQRRNARF